MNTVEYPTIDSSQASSGYKSSKVATGIASSIGAKLSQSLKVGPDPNKKTVMSFDGVEVVSDAPTNLFDVEAPDSDMHIQLNPNKLDLPDSLGEPKISLKDGSKIWYYDIEALHGLPTKGQRGDLESNRLVIVSTLSGTRFSVGHERREGQPYRVVAPKINDYIDGRTSAMNVAGGVGFLERLGYLFVNGQVYAPSPQTFKRYCEQEGIAVKIMEDEDEIPPEKYIESFMRRTYPVGAKEMILYRHDIADDHITAILLGGRELQDAIAESVERLITEGGIPVKDIAGEIDEFTNIFRHVILPPSEEYSDSPAYDKYRVRNFLKESGLLIPPERVDELIVVAQERARNFGLEPRVIA